MSGADAAATRTIATAMVKRRNVAVGWEFGMGASFSFGQRYFADANADLT